jgi:integrase
MAFAPWGEVRRSVSDSRKAIPRKRVIQLTFSSMPRRIGNRYYTDFRFKGQRIRQVLPEARTADQAKRLEARIRDQYFEGSFGDPAASHTLVDFAQKVWLPWCKENRKSPKGYRNDQLYFRSIKAFFGNRTFAEIPALLIERFKRQRLRDGLQPASVNRELAALSKIFRFAIQKRITNENPVSQVKKLIENNQRTRFLSSDEEARLLDALLLNPTLTAIVVLAIHTGMRQGEILKLQWSDINNDARLIHVRDTKTGHDRIVPLNESARTALQDLPREKRNPWVFPGTGKTGHLVEIKKAWATALKAAGITDFRFHDLRHTAGTRLAAVGTHPMIMMELLGHKNLQTTKRYTHGTEEAKRAAMAALENFGQKYVKETEVVPFKQALNG